MSKFDLKSTPSIKNPGLLFTWAQERDKNRSDFKNGCREQAEQKMAFWPVNRNLYTCNGVLTHLLTATFSLLHPTWFTQAACAPQSTPSFFAMDQHY